MKKDNKQTITIQEDVRVPGTDILLEKGDKTQILSEKSDISMISVTYEGKLDDYTIFGRSIDGEVNFVINTANEDAMEIGYKDEEKGLWKVVDAVNTLLSYSVTNIDVR